MSSSDIPVSDSLYVTAFENIYKQDEWWKAVVRYGFDAEATTTETAVYLWHNDGEGWTRKNKYVIKTTEAWETDRAVITELLQTDRPSQTTTEFPASDYYTIGASTTIFQSDGWWKAILNVVEKGSYETDEVMIYVWQQVDDEWRRRQKYTIKTLSNWKKEREIVDRFILGETVDDTSPEIDVNTDEVDSISAELEKLDKKLSAHLSEEFDT
jgi:hypothetical protein